MLFVVSFLTQSTYPYKCFLERFSENGLRYLNFQLSLRRCCAVVLEIYWKLKEKGFELRFYFILNKSRILPPCKFLGILNRRKDGCSIFHFQVLYFSLITFSVLLLTLPCYFSYNNAALYSFFQYSWLSFIKYQETQFWHYPF